MPDRGGEREEELARHDAAAAWALQAAGSSAWWCLRLPDDTVEEIYRDGPDQLVSVSFPVYMDATRQGDGFRLSGRRSFASNMSEASWVWVTAVCPHETVDGAPVTRAAFLPASEVTFIGCWDTVGMRGTDSNDVELHGAYVPERRTFRIGMDHTPGPRYEGPLYRGAAMLLVASYIPAVALGIAQDAIDEVVAPFTGRVRAPLGGAAQHVRR